MRKNYRLIVDISVDVNEKVKVKGKIDPKRLGYIQQFLNTISKNEDILRDYCTHFFTDLLLNGQCYEELFDIWGTRDMPEIVTIPDIKKELTPDASAFINMIYSTAKKKTISDDDCAMYKILILDQILIPNITAGESKII